jgi:hypothetical protein
MLHPQRGMDTSDMADHHSSGFTKIYTKQLPTHDSLEHPEDSRTWLEECCDIVSSIDDHEGDTLILILKGRMLAYGIPTRDNYAPLWLKDDADLNYLTCYDSPNGPTTDPFPEKCVQLGPKGKALDIALFHALKRCVQGPLLLLFDRVTKQSYMQVALLMYKQIYDQSPRAKIQVLASMLNTSWKGDVDQWRSELMDRHMEIKKIKFTYREISLLGVMISAERFSPTLFSQVALVITEMRPGDSFDDDITKICLLAQQYQGIADSKKCGFVPHQDIVPMAERPVPYDIVPRAERPVPYDEFHTLSDSTLALHVTRHFYLSVQWLILRLCVSINRICLVSLRMEHMMLPCILLVFQYVDSVANPTTTGRTALPKTHAIHVGRLDILP